MRIPVEINTNGDVVDDDDYQPQDLEDEERDGTAPTLRGGPHSFHVSRKAVAKFGTTEGCAACTALKRLGHLKGKLNHNHSEACWKRIIRLMLDDPQYTVQRSNGETWLRRK